MIISGLQNVVKFMHLISKEAVKEVLKFCVTFLKNPIKLLTSPFPMMLQTFFTRRALEGGLGTRRSFK